ncbi:unnamed protein product, partial [Mesorhabditis spiculigera]
MGAGKKPDSQRRTNKSAKTKTSSTKNRGKHTQLDQKAVEHFIGTTICKKGLAQLITDFKRHPRICDMAKCTVFSRNQKLNRYKDVGCLDNNRVRVQGINEDEYIHANYVPTLKCPKRFICTQAPINETCADFWAMIMQEEVKVILMLCDMREQGKIKCANYFPAAKGETTTFGDFTVTCELEKEFVSPSKTPANIKHLIMKVTKEGGAQHTVNHYHWVSWPDRSVPPADLVTVELLEKVNETTKPIVIHCSAGVGRTGSVVMLQMALEMLADGQMVDMEALLVQIRESRANSVQTAVQYLFVHEVLLNMFRVRGKMDKAFFERHQVFLEKYAAAIAAELQQGT